MNSYLETVDFRLPTGLEGREQYHIRCKPGDVAPAVLVPGDQGRIQKIVAMLDGAEKKAENRGMITYTGAYKGWPVSVVSTGMGGPSAAIAYEELINVGAKLLIRVGSMAGLQPEVHEGDVIIAFACIRDDGASHYYVSQNYPAVASPDVVQALVSSARELSLPVHVGINWTHSCFYNRSPEYFQAWARKRVTSMEMEGATLFVVAALRGVRSGLIGTCYANRALQSQHDAIDLSVPPIDREVIERGVQNSIEISLEAVVRMYESGSVR
ncbi:MAG: nucleoside phosphorylase [Bacillota bacterium]